jgi:hypothetical protein
MDQDAASGRWEPEDEDDYEAANAELKMRFAVWAGDKGIEEGPEAPIYYKWGYLDGHLTRWTRRDLDEVYLEPYPARAPSQRHCEPVASSCRTKWTKPT